MSHNNPDHTVNGNNQYNQEYNNYAGVYSGQPYSNNGSIPTSKFSAMNITEYLGGTGNSNISQSHMNTPQTMSQYGGSYQSPLNDDNQQVMYQRDYDPAHIQHQDQTTSNLNNYSGLPMSPSVNSSYGYRANDANYIPELPSAPAVQQYNSNLIQPSSQLRGMLPGQGIPLGPVMLPRSGIPPGQGIPTSQGLPPNQGIPLIPRMSSGQTLPPGQGMIPGHGLPPGQSMPPGQGMPPIQRMAPGQGGPQSPYGQQGVPQSPYTQQGVPQSPYAQQGVPQSPYAQQGGPQSPYGQQGQISGRGPHGPYSNLSSQTQSLNPDSMPSAVQVIEQDKCNSSYNTGARDKIPPLVTTDFVAIDQGTSNPKFIRSTLYSVPATPDMLKSLHIPFALNITPFAKLDHREQAIVCGETGEKGPIRCIRCKAYMSPLMTFIDGGRRFQCNLCRANTDVTEDYFVHLDQNGTRIDCYQRPELCLGSYELMATKEYCRNDTLPKAPAFIFMIDVSYASVKSGLVNVICNNMKDYILPYLATDALVSNSPKPLVGFITYDRVLHFYNMKSKLTKPQMYVVSYFDNETTSDLVPIVDGFLVDPDEAIEQIQSLMENIIETFSANEERAVILGPVIEAGMEALKAADNRPGKLFVFHSSLPVVEAPGKLKARDDRSVLGTDKEKSLFLSGSSYYTKLAENCVKAGVSVDLFLTPSAFIDVATLSELPKITGGNLFKYDFFSPANHAKQFISDLQQAVSAPCAFDAVMRVRTSLGTRAVEYYGNFYMNNTEDVNLACVDANKSVVVEIKHNDKLPEKDVVYIQAAVLYTSISGQRRLRIHNISFNVSTSMSDIFKMTDLDTIMNWMSKYSIKVFQTKSIKEVRDEVCQKSAQILASYRRTYSEQSKPAELILPENLKLLPLYANSLLKCDFMQSGTDLVTDERTFLCFLLNSMDVRHTQVFLYPRLLPLKNLEDISSSSPLAIRDNYVKLSSDGVFLIENGVIMYFFIGKDVEPEWLHDVFNCNNLADIVDRGELPVLESEMSIAIRRLIETIRLSRSRYMKMVIVIQGEKLESAFKKLLVEDHSDRGGSSYVEFLCQVHKEIRTILNN